jgi:hypothetical protein
MRWHSDEAGNRDLKGDWIPGRLCQWAFEK